MEFGGRFGQFCTPNHRQPGGHGVAAPALLQTFMHAGQSMLAPLSRITLQLFVRLPDTLDDVAMQI